MSVYSPFKSAKCTLSSLVMFGDGMMCTDKKALNHFEKFLTDANAVALLSSSNFFSKE